MALDASAIRRRQSGMELLLLTILWPRYVNSETPSTLCPLTVIELAGGPTPTFCILVFVHDTWSPNLADSCSMVSSALDKASGLSTNSVISSA